MTEEKKYPIGKVVALPFSEEVKKERIADIRFLPNALEAAVSNLDEGQLQTPYREGGWTLHQVVHHVADSHMNAYIRFKLGYTEDNPTIKPYEENDWANLADVKVLPVNVSITLLYALHHRWVEFLQNLNGEDWNKTVFHPEHKKNLTLWELLGIYAWHGKHHTAHINMLRKEKNW